MLFRLLQDVVIIAASVPGTKLIVRCGTNRGMGSSDHLTQQPRMFQDNLDHLAVTRRYNEIDRKRPQKPGVGQNRLHKSDTAADPAHYHTGVWRPRSVERTALWSNTAKSGSAAAGGNSRGDHVDFTNPHIMPGISNTLNGQQEMEKTQQHLKERQQRLQLGHFLTESRQKQHFHFGEFALKHMRRMAKTLPRDVPQKSLFEDQRHATSSVVTRNRGNETIQSAVTSQVHANLDTTKTSANVVSVYRPTTSILRNKPDIMQSTTTGRRQWLESTTTEVIMTVYAKSLTKTAPDEMTHTKSTMTDEVKHASSTMTNKMTNISSTTSDEVIHSSSTMTTEITRASSTITDEEKHTSSTPSETHTSSTITDEETHTSSTLTETHTSSTPRETHTSSTPRETHTSSTLTETHTSSALTEMHTTPTITAEVTNDISTAIDDMTHADVSHNEDGLLAVQGTTHRPTTPSTHSIPVTGDSHIATAVGVSEDIATTVQNANSIDTTIVTSQKDNHPAMTTHAAVGGDTDILQTTSASRLTTARRWNIAEDTGKQRSEARQTLRGFDFVTVEISDVSESVTSQSESTPATYNNGSDRRRTLTHSQYDSRGITYEPFTDVVPVQNTLLNSRSAIPSQNPNESVQEITKNTEHYQSATTLRPFLPNITKTSINTNTTRLDHVAKTTAPVEGSVHVGGEITGQVTSSQQPTEQLMQPTTGRTGVGCRGRWKYGRRQKTPTGVKDFRPRTHGEGIQSEPYIFPFIAI